MPGSEDCYRCPDFFWSSIYRNVCSAMPEEYLAFADPVAIALLAVALFGFVLVLAVIAIMIWFHELFRSKNDPKMPMVVLMATVAFSFASTLSFLGKPVDITCRAQRALIFFLLTLSISCLLTMIVGLIAGNKSKNKIQVKYIFLKKQHKSSKSRLIAYISNFCF